ncbi:MAG: glycoside hydrolase family 25 protein [Clostridia bacterium]|nr:glycoside hydrolase family 25 protein [Clostridia bacterium]
MKKGIDVSTFQGDIDWEKVKKGGTEFAIIRGGYGRYEKDEKFEKNYKNAKNAGVSVGVYHYSYANTVEKARQEAQFCLSYLKGKKLEYPVAFDIEDKSLLPLSKKLLTDITYAFCDEIEKHGYYVCIYSYKAFLNDKLDMKKLSKFDVWVAQWNDVCTYNGNYGMWQYSDNGRISGISGRTDLDKAYRDYPKIMRENGLNGYKKSNKSEYEKGDEITLKNTPVYVSSTAKSPAAKITGKYYIYDGIKINGRYRITNSKRNVGRKPMINYVTGWIDKK